MSMNGSALGTAIAAALDSAGYLADGVSADDIEALWQVVGGEIITHITTNAVITNTSLPTLPVQVVPASGTGATTIPDVITSVLT